MILFIGCFNLLSHCECKAVNRVLEVSVSLTVIKNIETIALNYYFLLHQYAEIDFLFLLWCWLFGVMDIQINTLDNFLPHGCFTK